MRCVEATRRRHHAPHRTARVIAAHAIQLQGPRRSSRRVPRRVLRVAGAARAEQHEVVVCVVWGQGSAFLKLSSCFGR